MSTEVSKLFFSPGTLSCCVYVGKKLFCVESRWLPSQSGVEPFSEAHVTWSFYLAAVVNVATLFGNERKLKTLRSPKA